MQAIDLFSGAGGMSLGAEACGVRVRYAVENDRDAAATFELNHPSTKLLKRDVRRLRASDFSGLNPREPAILFGGPPCQGFSTSNQKLDKDRKNHTGMVKYGNERRQWWGMCPGKAKPEWIVESILWMDDSKEEQSLKEAKARDKR